MKTAFEETLGQYQIDELIQPLSRVDTLLNTPNLQTADPYKPEWLGALNRAVESVPSLTEMAESMYDSFSRTLEDLDRGFYGPLSDDPYPLGRPEEDRISDILEVVPTSSFAASMIPDTGRAGGKVLGTIIGPQGANTTEKAMLKKAQKMKAEGASADEIFEATKTDTSSGWWLDHPDGVPRAEISDKDLMVKEDLGVGWGIRSSEAEKAATSAERWSEAQDLIDKGFSPKKIFKLTGYQRDDSGLWSDFYAPAKGSSIIHDPLAARYPSKARDLRVELKPPSKEFYGGLYDSDRNAIDYTTSPEAGKQKQFAGHELQHFVSGEEGMAAGGSPKMFVQQQQAEGIRAAIWWSDEIRQVQDKYGIISPYAAEKRLIKEYKDADLSEFIPEPGIRDDAKQAEFMYRENYPEDFQSWQDLVNIYGLSTRTTAYTPKEMYHRLADEAQAEMVEKRLDLSLSELQENPFYKQYPVEPDDMIILSQDGQLQIQRNK